MHPDLIKRLVCSKYLFLRGQETLNRLSPFHQGIAVLAFHDCVELCLRVIAEHIGARVGENIQFQAVIDKIDEVGKGTVPCRTELNQLNRLRISFKHLALVPSDDDARKAERDTRVFLDAVLAKFADLSFGRLSLVNLVRATRVRHRLLQAEALLERDQTEESIENAAVALRLFLALAPIHSRQHSLTHEVQNSAPRNIREGGEVPRSVIALAAAADKEVERVWEQLDLVFSGIDLVAYRRFLGIAPHIDVSAVGTTWVSSRAWEQPPSYEMARFCFDFALHSILTIQNSTPHKSDERPPDPDLVVTHDSPVIVYPERDREHETIYPARVGEQLTRALGPDRFMGFVALIVDGQLAYIAADAVAPLES